MGTYSSMFLLTYLIIVERASIHSYTIQQPANKKYASLSSPIDSSFDHLYENTSSIHFEQLLKLSSKKISAFLGANQIEQNDLSLPERQSLLPLSIPFSPFEGLSYSEPEDLSESLAKQKISIRSTIQMMSLKDILKSVQEGGFPSTKSTYVKKFNPVYRSGGSLPLQRLPIISLPRTKSKTVKGFSSGNFKTITSFKTVPSKIKTFKTTSIDPNRIVAIKRKVTRSSRKKTRTSKIPAKRRFSKQKRIKILPLKIPQSNKLLDNDSEDPDEGDDESSRKKQDKLSSPAGAEELAGKLSSFKKKRKPEEEGDTRENDDEEKDDEDEDKNEEEKGEEDEE